MIKVKKNRVFDGLNTYEPGDMISGLSAEDEAALVDDGVAEYVGDSLEVAGDKHEDPTNEAEGKDVDEDQSEEQPDETPDTAVLNLDLDDVIVEAPKIESSRKGK